MTDSDVVALGLFSPLSSHSRFTQQMLITHTRVTLLPGSTASSSLMTQFRVTRQLITTVPRRVLVFSALLFVTCKLSVQTRKKRVWEFPSRIHVGVFTIISASLIGGSEHKLVITACIPS